MRVTYVGRTEHLWTVTKGRLRRAEGAAVNDSDCSDTRTQPVSVSTSSSPSNFGLGASWGIGSAHSRHQSSMPRKNGSLPRRALLL